MLQDFTGRSCLLQREASLQSTKAAGPVLLRIQQRTHSAAHRLCGIPRAMLPFTKGQTSCCTTVPHHLTCAYPAAGNRARGPPATARASASLTARSSRGWTTCTLAGHSTLLAWCVCLNGLAGMPSMAAAAGRPVYVISRPLQSLQHDRLAGLQGGRACFNLQSAVLACACSADTLHQGQDWALYDWHVVVACSREVLAA